MCKKALCLINLQVFSFFPSFEEKNVQNVQLRISEPGMDLLMEWVATGAFHNSDELYDAPKCHPHTRVAVLDDIMQWVCKTESEREDFMMWLFGPAGAGKSAIAKRIAEIAAEKGLLIAAFFFSRTSSTRGSKDRLIATLAYQLALSIPETRTYIEDAVERDPAIFNKSIRTQIDTLLIEPFHSVLSAQIIPSQKLIIVDGLDECNDSQVQVAILDAICRSFPTHQLPIKFLVVSRPEIDLATSFNSDEPIKSVHRRLALDDGYKPDDDIRLFFSDKFEHIKLTHPLISTIPVSWPTEDLLKTLVRKSSGQFIYAATVVRFVESKRHRPTARLKMILEISPGAMNPFAELDALYNHVLSSVDDIQLTLRVLSFYVMTPKFPHLLRDYASVPPELFLSLEPGDIQMALINSSSIVSYDESSGEFTTLHASLADFLSDKRRSKIFHIDLASTCTDFICRILQCVKGPDGIGGMLPTLIITWKHGQIILQI